MIKNYLIIGSKDLSPLKQFEIQKILEERARYVIKQEILNGTLQLSDTEKEDKISELTDKWTDELWWEIEV